MGYQESFLVAKTNKDTKKLLKAMQRENIRTKDDVLASAEEIGTIKEDVTTYNNIELEKGREMILITGERMHSVDEYLLKGFDEPVAQFTEEEKKIISETIMIPLECFVEMSDIRFDKIIEDKSIKNNTIKTEDEEEFE